MIKKIFCCNVLILSVVLNCSCSTFTNSESSSTDLEKLQTAVSEASGIEMLMGEN